MARCLRCKAGNEWIEGHVKPEVRSNDLLSVPCGLTKRDTIEDALKRADQLASSTSYSGMMTANKDLRRIVLLAYEYRKLKGR